MFFWLISRGRVLTGLRIISAKQQNRPVKDGISGFMKSPKHCKRWGHQTYNDYKHLDETEFDMMEIRQSSCQFLEEKHVSSTRD